MIESATAAVTRTDGWPPVRLRTAFAALLGIFVAEVVLIGGYLLLVKAAVLPAPGSAAMAVLLGAATVVAVGVGYEVLLRRGRLSFGQLGFVRPTWRLLHLLWQTPLTILGSAAVAALVLQLTTGSTVRSGRGRELAEFTGASPGVVVAVLLAGVVVTPLWEETLFRGAFHLGFQRVLGPVGAVVASAALFAGFHVLPALWAFLFPLGLFLGWLRWFHRNLWASVAVHGCNNLLSMSAILLIT